jgi:hypothetical protein
MPEKLPLPIEDFINSEYLSIPELYHISIDDIAKIFTFSAQDILIKNKEFHKSGDYFLIQNINYPQLILNYQGESKFLIHNNYYDQFEGELLVIPKETSARGVVIKNLIYYIFQKIN